MQVWVWVSQNYPWCDPCYTLMMRQPMSELGSVCCLILLKRAVPINENAGKTASNHKVANIVYKT
jgi:hypothetical protein